MGRRMALSTTPDVEYFLGSMLSARWVLIFTLLLAGCDKGLKQRTEEVKEFSKREDRMFTAQALAQVKRRYWTVDNRAWYGKQGDGTIIRLNDPHVRLEPLPSRAFYRGWHLQMTIESEDWRTYPSGVHGHVFAAVYAMTRHSATAWDIRVTNGLETAPLRHEDGVRVRAEGE